MHRLTDKPASLTEIKDFLSQRCVICSQRLSLQRMDIHLMNKLRKQQCDRVTRFAKTGKSVLWSSDSHRIEDFASPLIMSEKQLPCLSAKDELISVFPKK